MDKHLNLFLIFSIINLQLIYNILHNKNNIKLVIYKFKILIFKNTMNQTLYLYKEIVILFKILI